MVYTPKAENMARWEAAAQSWKERHGKLQLAIGIDDQ